MGFPSQQGRVSSPSRSPSQSPRRSRRRSRSFFSIPTASSAQATPSPSAAAALLQPAIPCTSAPPPSPASRHPRQDHHLHRSSAPGHQLHAAASILPGVNIQRQWSKQFRRLQLSLKKKYRNPIDWWFAFEIQHRQFPQLQSRCRPRLPVRRPARSDTQNSKTPRPRRRHLFSRPRRRSPQSRSRYRR